MKILSIPIKQLFHAVVKNLALIILIGSAATMVFMLIKLKDAENKIAQSLTQRPVDITETELNRFFNPIAKSLLSEKIRNLNDFYALGNDAVLTNYFYPTLVNYQQISSLGIADDQGVELDLLYLDDKLVTRKVDIPIQGDTEVWQEWSKNGFHLTPATTWEEPLPHDPRNRSWHIRALEHLNTDRISWTDPYIFNTTGECGITASLGWTSPDDSLLVVLAYDLTLMDLTRFTESLKTTPNSRSFIVSKDHLFLGLPDHDWESSSEDMILTPVSEIGIPEIESAFDYWENHHEEATETFRYNSGIEPFWAYIKPFYINDTDFFLMGVIIPEADLLAQINNTRYSIMGGFVLILILSVIVYYSMTQTQKSNKMLTIKNQKITSQSLVIEEKNKDIVDSLNYAQRIQTALLPFREEMKSHFKDSFILFKPRDIVSGDFYWVEEYDSKVFFTVSDCTGHGVPGALMSMIGITFYNDVVKSKKITQPDRILSAVSDNIVDVLKQQEGNTQRDGMDVSFCVLDKKTKTLHFSGANNPIYIIRKDNTESPLMIKSEVMDNGLMPSMSHEDIHLYEVKGSKRSVGFYTGENEFLTHQIKLQEGDAIYLFSDGYADQFGGPSLTKGGKKMKYRRFKKVLLENFDQDMPHQCKELENFLYKWMKGYEQLDDICVIGVRV